MGTKFKKKLVAYIATIAMLLSVFNIPVLGYATQDEPGEGEQGYGIYYYDYDLECMAELTGEWEINLAELEGDPCDYFYVRPFDEEADLDYQAEWESSDPEVAECIDTGSNDEIKIAYLSAGYTTISASIDGDVVCSFGLSIEDYDEDYDEEEEESNLPAADIGFFVNGIERGDPLEFFPDDEGYYADYYLPYNYDSDKGFSVIVNHLDGTLTPYKAKMTDECETIEFTSAVEGVEETFRIFVYESAPSSEVGCSIYIYSENNDGETAYADINCEEAKDETAVLEVPYGYGQNIKLYIEPESEGAQVGNYDGYYSEENDEFIAETVTIGQIKNFTVTAEDGTKQDYSVKFVMSEGTSTEVELRVGYYDPNYVVEFATDGDYNCYRNVEFVDSEGVMVANIELPYMYNNEDGFNIQLWPYGGATLDTNDYEIYYLDENGSALIEFYATSANGKVSKKHVINVYQDTDGSSTDLDYFKLCYTDKDGSRVVQEISPEQAATDEGAVFELPAGAAISEGENLPRIECETKQNAYMIEFDFYAYGEAMYDAEGWEAEFELGTEEYEDAEFTFTVRASNGENTQKYKVLVKPHQHKYKKVVTKPTYFKKGYTTNTCACGYSFKDNYVSKKSYTAVPKTVKATLSTASKGYDNVKISWSKVSSADGYKVYYKKASSKKWSALKTVSSKTTSYTSKNLAAGTKFNFKVVPYVKSGKTVVESKKYKSASAVTLKKISTPKVAKSGSKVKVSWSNIGGETGYQISQSTKKSGTKIVATYKTTTGKSKVIKAKKGKKYYYKVRAYKQVGKVKVFGPWSKVNDYKRR